MDMKKYHDIRFLIGAPVLLIVVTVAIFSPLLAPYDPNQISVGNALQSPGLEHWLGTDELGRDILSRIMYGARISLQVAAAALGLAVIVGVGIGLMAAIIGGQVERLIMQGVNLLISLPDIFIAIFVVTLISNSLSTLTLTMAFIYFPQFAKVSNSVARTLRSREFVLASVMSGASTRRILWNEMLPNMTSVILVQASFTLSAAMLVEAGLSFLGLGVPPPAPSWGQMIAVLKNYIYINYIPLLFPAAVLFLVIFAVTLIGDWLQDLFNSEIR